MPDVRPEDLLLSLFGWMVTPGDHSIFEILSGAEIAGMMPPLPPEALRDAVHMYRSLPGIPLAELRRQVGEDGMLPHEAAYLARAVAGPLRGGFAEPGEEILTVARERRAAFEAVDTDADAEAARRVQRWLQDHGTTADETLERLSPAHFAALATYTGPAFPLLNIMIKSAIVPRRAALRHQIYTMIRDAAVNGPERTGLPHCLAVAPGMQELWHPAPGTPRQDTARLDALLAAAETMLPAIEQEMTIHADMLLEAMHQLPPAFGTVWRGTMSLGDLRSGFGRTVLNTFGGSEVVFNEFTSASRDGTVALLFSYGRRQFPLTHRVVVEANLTGHMGRDISPFSCIPAEDEVLLIPGARFEITSRDTSAAGVERIQMTERHHSFPLPAMGNLGEARARAKG